MLCTICLVSLSSEVSTILMHRSSVFGRATSLAQLGLHVSDERSRYFQSFESQFVRARESRSMIKNMGEISRVLALALTLLILVPLDLHIPVNTSTGKPYPPRT